MFSFLVSILIAGLVLVFSIVGLVLRIFFPWLSPFRRGRHRPDNMSGGTSGSQGRPSGSWGGFGQEKRQKREGEVSIDYIPPRKDFRNAKPSNNVSPSEYVDFEEVKEKDEV